MLRHTHNQRCRLRLSPVMFLYCVAIDMQTGEARASWCPRESQAVSSVLPVPIPSI